MRVLVLTTSYPRDEDDPSGHFVRAEVRALRARGDDVTVLVPRGAAFGWPGVAARLRERPARALGGALELFRLRREGRDGAPFDRAIAHWGGITWSLARGLAPWLELVSHGADVRLLRAVPESVRSHAVATMARSASSWRFVSESLRDELVDGLDRDARRAVMRIARVEAPVLEMNLHEARARGDALRRHHGQPLFAAVGRLVRSKRVDLAIEHVATAGCSARLIVVGDGPEREALVALARARAVDARFVGTQGRSEALAYIAAADALLHASEAEGLSSVVREAEALGTPVVRVGRAE